MGSQQQYGRPEEGDDEGEVMLSKDTQTERRLEIEGLIRQRGSRGVASACATGGFYRGFLSGLLVFLQKPQIMIPAVYSIELLHRASARQQLSSSSYQS